MSQDMLDPEILADFIIEAKEHLETIEPNLLKLEKDPDNLGLLNDIFRPMHSLKGASGFLGLNLMNALAHRAENVLDELRNGVIHVNTEIMDVILEATDVLRQIIDNIELSNTEGDVNTEATNRALDALLDIDQSAANANDDNSSYEDNEEKIFESSEDLIEQGEVELREQIADVESWINERDPVDPYKLVAFGEDHLRDFIEEAKENCSSLSEQLLVLENDPENDELINEMFRLFHNLKGNSGIIGYQEVNILTHEAETLLNNVRKHEFEVSTSLIDLLLLAVDVLDALIARIDSSSAEAKPFDTTELVLKLQHALATGEIQMPESILIDQEGKGESAAKSKTPKKEEAKSLTSSESKHSNEDIRIFEETIAQQIATINSALKVLSADGNNRDMIDALFRSLNTIKNACGVMGMGEIKDYAERTAGIVDKGRDTNLDFSMMTGLLEQECAIIRDMIKNILENLQAESPKPVEPTKKTGKANGVEDGKKRIEESLEKIAAGSASKPEVVRDASKKDFKKTPKRSDTKKTEKKQAAAARTEVPKASSTIRVEHEKLDHLMNVIGEIIINRNRFTMLARQLEEVDKLEQVSEIAQNLSETTYSMAHISDDLQATIMQVRMVPVSSVFSRFPRLVRDLSRRSKKDVDLIVEGEETELDKSVVEVIGDPLVHLIRNSVDHGIESAEDRKAAGKDPKGKVYLRASYRGNSVAIDITDDGRGIDPDKMRKVGVKKGLVTEEEAELLDDKEAMELVFAPGFSSAEEVTDISGRGVGMDVVRTNIKSLKGSISISSELGKGTTFSMLLPLTLAIIDALMVNVAGEMLAIPLDSVAATTKIKASRLTDMKGRKAVTLRGEVLGIVSLAAILGLECKMAELEELSVVIIQDGERNLGLVVDTLHERQEIVIKPLGEYLGDVEGVSGATIMGDGSVILILDPHEIYLLATKV